MKNSIEIKGICKDFAGVQVLKTVNLNVGAGEIFGLLGPSGAGKTTLIQILTGQLQQSDGTAVILGADTQKLTDRIYEKMGLMLDNSGLYERLTCFDNLELFARLYNVPKQNIDSALQKVGLLEAKKRPVQKLSKGMKQRLILARAMLHSPEIYFLDEPSSGLDPGTAAQIHRLILEEKKRGATIFLTTHNMEEAEKLCDHVALLHEGRIVEYGVPEEICRKYNHQKQICILLKDGETQVLKNGCKSAGQIGELFARDMVETIHSTEPHLETVFMERTGRKLDV